MSTDRLDEIVEQMKGEPRIQKIIQDARLFGELRENEAWKALYKRVLEDKQTFAKKLGRRIMGGEKVSPEEIAFHRGFYQGAKWIISHPEMAEKSLERAASLAYTMASETDEGSE